MYDIYISHHLTADGTATIETEELLYSIPISDSNSDKAVIDPVVSCEMGKSGSFEFSIPPVHPFYNRFQQMKTIMRVNYDGDNIFRGRVLTIDTNQMNGNRKIHLEGDLAFLMDSYQEGVDDGDRPKTDILTYLNKVIRQHNEQVDVEGSTYKKMVLGEVPGQYTSAISVDQQISISDSEFGSSSWQKTSDAFGALTKKYGGYLRTRYAGGVCYLDWLEAYFNKNVNTQPIKVTENMIDLSATAEVENIFTVLVPIGNDNSKKLYINGYLSGNHVGDVSITVPEAAAYLTSAGRGNELNKGFHTAEDYINSIEKYGIIYKTQEFQNANTKEKLWNEAVNWIKDNYVGGIVSFSASALDFHHIDGSSYQKYLVGDKVVVIYADLSKRAQNILPSETKTITLLTAQYRLHNPEKNQYTLGVPNTLLSKSYSKKSSKKSKNDSIANNNMNDRITDESADVNELKELAEIYVLSKKFNNADYTRLAEENPDKAEAALKITTALIHSVYKATKGQTVWVKTSTHNQRSTDEGSIYKASNGTEWKLKTVYKTQIELEPVSPPAEIPPSGTLTWVSGGVFHTKITYGNAETIPDKRMWIYTADHKQTSGKDKGSIYKDSNNAQWELVTIFTDRIELVPLVNSSALPSSGTLKWVSGGQNHDDIVYSKTKSNIQSIVSTTATMTFDGIAGKYVSRAPLGDESQYTDEQLKTINRFAASVVIDAANQELGIYNPLEFDSETGQVKHYSKVLARLGLGQSSDSGNLQLFDKKKIEEIQNVAETVGLFGETGAGGFMQTIVGQDGTTTLGTVITNGKNSIISLLDPENAGSQEYADVYAELTGQNGGTGKFGRNDSTDWRIKLNDQVTYTDKDGLIHILEPGFVTAEDISIFKNGLNEIPSFRTKVAVIDTALIGVAYVGDLTAINAFIQDLQGSTAKIDRITAKNITAQTKLSAPGGISSSNYVYIGRNLQNDLEDCFNDAEMSEANGVITLTLKRAKYTEVRDTGAKTVSFNMAATEFYQNAIAAAKSLVMPTAIAWDGTNRYFESHNPYNRDNSVKEEVQLVCDTSETDNPIYYASMQSRVYGSETPWNNRIRKTLAIADVDNNNVRLRFDGADTSLVYEHGQYTAGESAGKKLVMPTAIAWDGTNRYFESHNPYNRDNSVKEEVQLVCDTSGTSNPIYYASMQSRVYESETPWNNRIRKTLAITDVDNNNVRLRFDGADTSLVYKHGQYTAGWGVARTSTGDFPTSTNTYVSSITVKRPSSTVGGTADSYTYGLHTEGRTLIQLKYNDQTVVAQISNPYYYTTLEYNDYGETQFIAGKDSVNHDPVVSLSYVGREETSYPPISGLNLGSASQREITSFWCVAQAQCKDGDIVQATNNFRFSVNASQVYNNGYDKATSLIYFDNPGSSKTYMEIHYPGSSDRTSSTGIIGYFHLVQSGNTVYLVYSSSTSTPSSSSAESEKRAQLSVSTPSHSPTAYHNTVWKTTNSLMDLLDRMGKDQSEVSAFISSSQLARNTWYGFCAQCGSSKKYYYFHTS